MRSVAAAVAAVLSAVLLSGCGSGPSQLGAAAIVGDTEISIEYVQSWWDRVLADPELKERVRTNAEFDDLGRVIVTEAVRHELLRRAAERENLRFDEAQVSELVESIGGEQAAVEATNSIYDKDTIRERVRDQLLAVGLARKYFDTTVRYDSTVVESRQQALDKARELAANPDRARSIIEADGRNGAPVELDRRQSIGDDVDGALRTPLFAVPEGNVVAFRSFSAASQGQWIVAVLHERTVGVSSGMPGAATADRVDESRLGEIGMRLLGPIARDIGVRVNPRYGVWSDAYVSVWPSDGETPVSVFPMANRAAS